MCQNLNQSNIVTFELFGVLLRYVTSCNLVNNYGCFGGTVMPCPPSKIFIYHQLAVMLSEKHSYLQYIAVFQRLLQSAHRRSREQTHRSSALWGNISSGLHAKDESNWRFMCRGMAGASYWITAVVGDRSIRVGAWSVPLLPSAMVLSLRGETPFLRSTLVITQSFGFVLILRNKYANYVIRFFFHLVWRRINTWQTLDMPASCTVCCNVQYSFLKYQIWTWLFVFCNTTWGFAFQQVTITRPSTVRLQLLQWRRRNFVQSSVLFTRK